MNDTSNDTSDSTFAIPALTIKQFAALDPVAKRKAVVRDAIEQVQAKRLLVRTGNYFKMNGFKNFDGLELRDRLLDPDFPYKQCQVCALGACFVSTIRLENYFIVSKEERGYSNGLDKVTGSFLARLQAIFDPFQIDLIEAAFERSTVGLSNYSYGRNLTEKENSQIERAISFGSLCAGGPEDRLVAILTEILNSEDGTFNP